MSSWYFALLAMGIAGVIYKYIEYRGWVSNTVSIFINSKFSKCIPALADRTPWEYLALDNLKNRKSSIYWTKKIWPFFPLIRALPVHTWVWRLLFVVYWKQAWCLLFCSLKGHVNQFLSSFFVLVHCTDAANLRTKTWYYKKVADKIFRGQ